MVEGLEEVTFTMGEGDYLTKFKTWFSNGGLVGIEFGSRSGKEIKIKS